MDDQPAKQSKSNIDQEKQTVVGSQQNTVYNIIIDPKAVVLITIVSGAVLGFGVRVAINPIIIILCLLWAILVTTLRFRALEQARQQQIEQERNSWYTLERSQLEEKLKQTRYRRQRLFHVAENGILLTKQKYKEYDQLQEDTVLLCSLIGVPLSENDKKHLPYPVAFIRWLHDFRVVLTHFGLVLLLAFIGTTIPRLAEQTLILIKEFIPTPTPVPTPTSAPIVIVLPTLTPTFTPVPTFSQTATPVLLPTATMTLTVASTLAPTNTPLITLTPTQTQVVPTLSPTRTITVTLVLKPRSDLGRATPATATMTQTPSVTATPTITASPTMTATPTPTATPTVDPKQFTGYLAYPVFNGRYYDTVVYDLKANAEIYRVAQARQPDLRGGGYLLVNGEGGSLLRVDIMRRDERTITQRDEDARPHWAPSDNRFVLESFEQDKNTTILKLHLDNTDPSNPPYLRNPNGGTTNGRNAVFLAEDRIAFNGCASWDAATSGNCGIWSINTNGTEVAQLTDQPHDYPSDTLGTQVLFTTDRERNWDVYITEGPLQPRRLTDDPARDGLATASPDGKYIAFVSDRGGRWAIWVMQADGSGQRPLLTEGLAFGAGDHDWTTEKISWGQ
jgi:hypothetical protein